MIRRSSASVVLHATLLTRLFVASKSFHIVSSTISSSRRRLFSGSVLTSSPALVDQSGTNFNCYDIPFVCNTRVILTRLRSTLEGTDIDALENGLQDTNSLRLPQEGENGENFENEVTCPYYTYASNLVNEALKNALISNEKQYNSLLNERRKAEECETLQYKANLILSNLWQIESGVEKVTVIDWEKEEEVELILNPTKYASPNEEADDLFATARKMKRGSQVVQELLLKNRKAHEGINILLQELRELQKNFEDSGNFKMTESEEVSLLSIWQRSCNSSKKLGIKKIDAPFTIEQFEDRISEMEARARSKNKPAKKTKGTSNGTTFRHFDSPSGLKVVVGRNRRDNEAICFKVGRGNDIWMHARGCPGAHVLLKVRRGSTNPTHEDIQFCANLAAFYSDARTENNALVTLAEVKHIQKPRGAPLGAVKLRQELGSHVGHPNDVPQECKDARSESGFGSDEAGKRSQGGKAKGKKRYEENLLRQRRKREKKSQHNSDDASSNFYNE